MSESDTQDGDVTFTNVVGSVGAYAVIYVDLSSTNRYSMAYGDDRDDLDRPFWNVPHRKRSEYDGEPPEGIFGGKYGELKEPVLDHFTPNDGDPYRIPWETDTVLAVILWDDERDEYMVVKKGDGITANIEDDFGSVQNHQAVVEEIRGYGPQDVRVKVSPKNTGKKTTTVDESRTTWIDPMQIRSVREDGPAWERGDDGHELTPQE